MSKRFPFRFGQNLSLTLPKEQFNTKNRKNVSHKW